MKAIRLSILFFVILLMSACGVAPAVQHPGTTDAKPIENTQNPATNGQQPNQEAKAKQAVKVYYADTQLTSLVEAEREIEYRTEDEKFGQVIALLGQPGQTGQEALWTNFTYHSILLKDGVLTIDASGANQYNLGSSGEAFAIEALTKSLFQFPEVKQIRILVDGKPTDSLMGHMDTSQPFSREQ